MEVLATVDVEKVSEETLKKGCLALIINSVLWRTYGTALTAVLRRMWPFQVESFTGGHCRA